MVLLLNRVCCFIRRLGVETLLSQVQSERFLESNISLCLLLKPLIAETRHCRTQSDLYAFDNNDIDICLHAPKRVLRMRCVKLSAAV